MTGTYLIIGVILLAAAAAALLLRLRATPIAEAMLALVLMDHALRHRAQNADVRCATPQIAAQAPEDGVARARGEGAIDNPDPDEA